MSYFYGETYQLCIFRRLICVNQVTADEKGRLTIAADTARDGTLLIRANQGHSMKGVVDEELLMTRIEDASEVPVCVHGTFLRNWAR